MKKKIAGFALIALAAGALSAQVTVSGSLDGIQTMGLGSSGDAPANALVNTHYIDARVTFTAKPSDFTTVVATMRARSYDEPNAYIPLVLKPGPKEQVTDTATKGGFDWEYLYAKVDVIGGLGLNIPAKANFIFGKIDYTSKNYLTTTASGVESVMNSIRSGDLINMGVEVAMKDLPLTLVALTRTNMDEAMFKLDSTTDAATTDTVPALYLAARLENYKTSLGNFSAEAAYALNSRKINSGNSYGASAKLSIPVSDAIAVPVGFGASYTEKNLDVLVDDTSAGFRDSTRIGAATGVSYKMSDDTTVALNVGGAYNTIKHKTFDTVNVMQVGVDGKAVYKNYFGGLGVVMGSLGDVDVGSTAYSFANSLGYEAYAGITPGKGCTVTLGYAAYSGLSARYAIAGKLPDASYKYVDSDGIAKTNVLYVKTAIKF